jgi:hypothetical protein
MMKPLFVVLIACFGFVLTVGAEQQKKEEKNKDQAGPVVNGLQLSLSADKTETVISKDGKVEKPVALKLTFTNVSDKAIKFNAYDFNWSRIKGEVKAMPADSVKLQRIAADRVPTAPKAGDFLEIKPGESWSYDKHLAFPGTLPESVGSKMVYEVVKPGEFRVRFTYNSPKGMNSVFARDAWTGDLVSNEVVITVRAANEKK